MFNLSTYPDLGAPRYRMSDLWKEVERLGGFHQCVRSDSKLNELAALVIMAEDSQPEHSVGRGAHKQVQLSATELRCLRLLVDDRLERNRKRLELNLYHPVEYGKHQHRSSSIYTSTGGARPYESINNCVSRYSLCF